MIRREESFPGMGTVVVVSPEGDFDIDGKKVHANERVTIVSGKSKKTIPLNLARVLIETAFKEADLRNLLGVEAQATFG